MTRILSIATASAFAFSLAACGGGGDSVPSVGGGEGGAAPAATSAPSGVTGELTTPSWFSYDATAGKVTMTVTAGLTNVANYWNFNGAVNGEMEIVVPVGAEVELTFVNQDPAMAHSLGIESIPGLPTVPPMFAAANPAFEGAVTSSPLDQLNATQTGESETIIFTADTAGEYTMICYVPGHALVGMWIRFTVSAEGEAGVRGAM